MTRDLRSKGLRTYKPLSMKRYAGKQHYHGCRACDRKYLCGCQTPEVNEICNDCRQGRDTFVMGGTSPRPCCAKRQPTDRDARERYMLAGSEPWWQCKTCANCFTSPGSDS